MKTLMLISILMSSLAFASTTQTSTLQSFKLTDATVQLSVPDKWKTARDLFGDPLTIVSPMDGDSRSVIKITPSKHKDLVFNSAEMDKNQNDFREERKKWLKEHAGNVIEFKDYQKSNWDGIKEVHTIGLKYSMVGEEFDEKGYFILCKNSRFIFAFTQMKTSLLKKYGDLTENTVKSIQCE